MYQVKLTMFPNNETRVSYCRMRPPSNAAEGDNQHPCQCPDGAECDCSNQTVLVNASPLDIKFDLGHVENSQESCHKPGWGDLPRPTRFTLHAHRTLLRCGGVIDRIAASPREVLFLTGTIPNGFDDGRITTSAYSAFIVYALKKWVSRCVPSKVDFYCWEYQKRGVLHLHYAVWVPKAKTRALLLEGFHEQWVRILLRIYDICGIDLCYSDNGCTDKSNTANIQAYAQEIYSSAGAYLAKYLSKGSQHSWSYTNKVLYPPTRWYGCSRPLLSLLKKMTVTDECIHIFRRNALTQYQDVATMLSSTSDVAYEYHSRYTESSTTVAYLTSHIGIEQCQIMMQSHNSLNGQTSQKPIAKRVVLRLRFHQQKWHISPANLSSVYTPFAALSLEKLLHGRSLNIIEAMEICDGFQYLLFLRYQNKPTQPESYERSQQELKRMYQAIREAYLTKQLELTEMLTKLD